jgi:hypothetical protein
MPGSVHVESVMNKLALGQVFLQVVRFSPVIVSSGLHAHISSVG